MITDKDVTKLKEVFATKEEFRKEIQNGFDFYWQRSCETFATKDQLEAVRKDLLDKILSGQDKIVGIIQDMRAEHAAAMMRMERHDRWIWKLADHTDCELAK